MIRASDLRIGNWVSDNKTNKLIQFKSFFGLANVESRNDEFSAIPLTPEILEKCRFNQLPHFTVNNGWRINIGRDRVLTVACVGTPNEMIFLTEEEPPIVKDIICLRNFDYDGKTYLHDLQNIYYALTKQELNYQP